MYCQYKPKETYQATIAKYQSVNESGFIQTRHKLKANCNKNRKSDSVNKMFPSNVESADKECVFQ